MFSKNKQILIVMGLILPFYSYAIEASQVEAKSSDSSCFYQQMSKLESTVGGRIGIAVYNTRNKETLSYRGNERFPFCSTGKVMTVAAILKASEKESDLLTKIIKYTKTDTDKSAYAPITSKYLAKGMTISELSQAALDYSDNTAMNLLVAEAGGVGKITDYARLIGDEKFRLDRMEPELNTAIPADKRDTTTPLAMTMSLDKLVLGQSLESNSQIYLTKWLKANTTGDKRIRAGLPQGWIVGDKTGTGAYGTTNDIGVIWAAKCDPIVISIYYTQDQKAAKSNDSVIASATKVAIDALAKNDVCLRSQLNLQ